MIARTYQKTMLRTAALLPLLVSIVYLRPLIAAEAGPLHDAERPKITTETPVKVSGVQYRSTNRRDPFLNPLTLMKTQKQTPDEELSRGLPPPGIAGTYIAQAVLQGVSIRDNGRMAVIRGADARAYFIREGDKLFDGYLKKIERDSITLVRETRMRSGKTLTQDVIKRLRTP